ncbi:MAG: VOC family protein [Deinococcota bacterium]
MQRIDHVIVRVDDLHDSVEEFINAGFSVCYGTKKEKAYNALIYLQDNSFLELLDTNVIPRFGRILTKLGILRVLSPAFNRIGNFYFKEGPLLDYPVYSSDIEASYAHVRDQSGKILNAGKRKKPNGTVVQWRSFMPKDLNLPFVMTDYTPEKISADETNVHPNGITGLHTLEIAFTGETADFRAKLINFYQVDETRVTGEGNCFYIQTDNATLVYQQASRHKITSTVLKPRVPALDNMLGKYSLATAN